MLNAKVAPSTIVGVGKALKVIFSIGLAGLEQPVALVTITL